MVGPRVYHLKHARSYPAFTASDTAKVMDLATDWLSRHDFRVKRKNKQYSKGSKKGIHVNFVPKFKLYIEHGTNGQYVVRFDYYAKIKLGTAVVVGVLTSGISTVIGVGTLAVNLSDADHFVDKFWKHIDSLARGTPVILTVERWASDGKGNMVKQPNPGEPVAVAAVPGPQVNPSLVKQQSQTNPSHVIPASQLPQPAHSMQPQPYAQSPHVHPAPVPGHGQYYGAPMPPPPPPPPPAPQYYPMVPPPMPPQTPPPNIQPGQVYGHNALRQTQTIQPSAPPALPEYPRMNTAPPHPVSGYPTPSHTSFAHPPQHPASYTPPTTPPAYAYGPPPPPPGAQNYPTTSHNQFPPGANSGNPPPPRPPKPDSLRKTDRNPPYAPHDHPAAAPPTSAHNYPAPPPPAQNTTSIPNYYPPSHSTPTPRGRPPSPTQSQRSYAPPPAQAPTTHDYPSSPSVHSNYHPPPSQTSSYPPPAVQSTNYPPAPQFNYPPAPSLAGSQGRSDDVTQNRKPAPTSSSSRVGSHAAYFQELANRQASQGDKPTYKGEQQAANKNANRMSQYDAQSFQIGENKSITDNTSSYTDTQSLKKSSETSNLWESSTSTGIAKH